jgi:hypothetical protein
MHDAERLTGITQRALLAWLGRGRSVSVRRFFFGDGVPPLSRGAASRSSGYFVNHPRVVDAVIIVGGDHRIASRAENVSLDWHDLIVVQTKASRLGMSLLGQALFSRLLIEDRFAPRSVRTVALCADDDAVLRPLAVRFGIEVVVDD